jgi:hypothetical protein
MSFSFSISTLHGSTKVSPLIVLEDKSVNCGFAARFAEKLCFPARPLAFHAAPQPLFRPRGSGGIAARDEIGHLRKSIAFPQIGGRSPKNLASELTILFSKTITAWLR